MSDVTSATSSASANPHDDKPSVPLPSPNRLTLLGVIVEVGCLVLAIALSYLGLYDRRQPLGQIFQARPSELAVWTFVAFSAISLCALLFLVFPAKPFRDFRAFVAKNLGPIFASLSVTQVAIISASAGLGEEMLFRWCIQGGLQNVWPNSQGMLYAVLVASLAFGLAHALTIMYVIVTTFIGCLLGVVMIICESVIPCILAHAIYDFVAILILQRTYKESATTSPLGPPVE